MNYDLARELKEAGFKGGSKEVYSFEEHTILSIPTLEELIEACGEGLQFNLLETSIGLFQASCWIDARGEERISRSGSTPTEAVARLWLALNKK